MSVRRGIVGLGSVLGLVAVGVTGPVEAAADRTVALWNMDEGSGANVAVDDSGNGYDGSIGDAIVTWVHYDGADAFRWKWTRPNEPPAKPERLIVIDDSPGLDPGSGDYAVTVRYRTTHKFGNILQKGQSRSRGGQWKFQAPKGIVHCLFKGSEGRSTTGSKRPLNDGEWHTVRCERNEDGVTMTVDGERTGRNRNDTGYIDNRVELTIGGKLHCDQVKVTCDYFVGDIDYVRIESE